MSRSLYVIGGRWGSIFVVAVALFAIFGAGLLHEGGDDARMGSEVRDLARDVAVARACAIPERLGLRYAQARLRELDRQFPSIRYHEIAASFASALSQSPMPATSSPDDCESLRQRMASVD